MSFFHVVVNTKDSESPACIFKDISEAELRKKFLNPYKLGKSVFFDGNIVSVYEFRKVKVVRTSLSHEKELKEVQISSQKQIEEMNSLSTSVAIISFGWGYEDHEIESCGKEVTGKYIDSGPGQGTTTSRLLEFMKHPWVVRIFGGLTLLGAAVYLGLR
jgi:hypothetical protein